jgi:hypothetical protein
MAHEGKIQKRENGRTVWRKPTDLDHDRIRFNWGYHDGAHDSATGFTRADKLWEHYDIVYVRGYHAGYEDDQNGIPTDSSEPAWVLLGLVDGITPYQFK